jgi:hypothetical protein
MFGTQKTAIIRPPRHPSYCLEFPNITTTDVTLPSGGGYVSCSLSVNIFFLLLCSQILGLGRHHETFRFISVTRFRTVSSTPWTGDQLVARPLLTAPGDCDDGEVGGMNGCGRGNRSIRRKSAPTPLCPPQIPLARPGREPGPPRWEASDQALQLWPGLIKYLP